MIYRLAKTPHLLRVYRNIIAEQERKGFIEANSTSQPVCEKVIHYTAPNCL